jgi:hypothetical protein
MEMKKIKSIYIYICMGIITIGSILFGYWYFIDGVYVHVPMTFKSGSVVTDKLVYKKGEPIAIRWSYCKGVDTVSEISITLTDGIIYFLPKSFSNRPTGCYDSYTVIASVPEVIPSGEYQLDGIINFKVNPLKSIDYKASSNTFKIEGETVQK